MPLGGMDVVRSRSTGRVELELSARAKTGGSVAHNDRLDFGHFLGISTTTTRKLPGTRHFKRKGTSLRHFRPSTASLGVYAVVVCDAVLGAKLLLASMHCASAPRAAQPANFRPAAEEPDRSLAGSCVSCC